MRALLREPIVRFGVLGGLVFALASALESPAVPGTIEVPGDVDDPAEAERWLDEEVLVRRAREHGIDRLDLVVRRRLAQQMRFLLEDMNDIAEPTDVELTSWLDDHRDRYRQPETASFRHVFFSRAARGEGIADDAQTAKEAITSGGDWRSAGDPFLHGSEFEEASPRLLARRFGPGFLAAIEDLPVGAWGGPIASSFGLHLVRVDARTPGRPSTLDEVRSEVRRDLMAQRRQDAERAMLDRLRADYGVAPAATTPAATEEVHGSSEARP